ncbi:chitinase [Plasmodium yoelii]|uniref:Chitinase n=1 Tax=Plasmodium yoelii TaxID=5861 RepID=A0A077Y518_PLAYE|nr:chitinase [Plasmodium yoelii]
MNIYVSLFLIIFSTINNAYSVGLKGRTAVNHPINIAHTEKQYKSLSHVDALCGDSKNFVCETKYICKNGTKGKYCSEDGNGVEGGNGNGTEVEGGNGNGTVEGGNGNGNVEGGNGNGTVEGGNGNGTEVEGGNGNGTEVEGGNGNGTEVEGGNGNGTEVEGGNGNGTEVEGGNGNGTEVEGGNGNGTVEGGNGNGNVTGNGNHERKSPREILEEYKKRKQGIIAGYYGSWNSQGAAGKQMTHSNPHVSVIYIAFARINMYYDASRPYNGLQGFLQKKHGLEFETYGMMTNEIKRIRKARPDVIIILSLGGETYMLDITKEIDYIPQIVNMVNNFDLDGVDIDWEPNGSFNNLNELAFSNYYIKLIDLIRSNISKDKLISISGSSNAALSCVSVRETFCKDEETPYNTQYLSEQMSVNPELYKAATMLSTGTFVNVFNTSKDKIDLVFIQTYNLETSNPDIMLDMYLSHLYFGQKYDITVFLGFSIEQNRGGFSPDNKQLVELVSKAIHENNHKFNRADGVGIWHLFMKEQMPNGAYDLDGFVANAWSHLNPGVPSPIDIVSTPNPDDCSTIDEYVQGIVIPNVGVYAKHNDAIWVTRSYSTRAPGIDRYEWNLVKVCYEKACNNEAAHYYNVDYPTGAKVVWKGEVFSIKQWHGGPPEGAYLEAYEKVDESSCPGLAEWNVKHPHKPLEVLAPYVPEVDG